MTFVIQNWGENMKIPKKIKEWMKSHTIADLEEYLFDERLSEKSQEILWLLSEMNELEALEYETEEIYA